jgi:hypothetical protein
MCECIDETTAKQHMADSLQDFALHAMPEIPEPGKWTKLFPALSFLVVCGCCCKFLPGRFAEAYKSMAFTTAVDSKRTICDTDVDPDLQKNIEWSKVTHAQFILSATCSEHDSSAGFGFGFSS